MNDYKAKVLLPSGVNEKLLSHLREVICLYESEVLEHYEEAGSIDEKLSKVDGAKLFIGEIEGLLRKKRETRASRMTSLVLDSTLEKLINFK